MFLDAELPDKETILIHSHAQSLNLRRRQLFIQAGPVKWRRRIGRCLLHAIRGDATLHVRKEVRVHRPAGRSSRHPPLISPNSARSEKVYPTPYPSETEAA